MVVILCELLIDQPGSIHYKSTLGNDNDYKESQYVVSSHYRNNYQVQWFLFQWKHILLLRSYNL